MRYHLGAAFAVAFAASVTPAMAAVEFGQLDCRGASQQFVFRLDHQSAVHVSAVVGRASAAL